MNKISFSGGMTTWHMHLMNIANPEKTSKKLKKDNIIADFNGSKIGSVTVLSTVDIFKKLKLNLPPLVEIYNFTKNRQYGGFCSLYDYMPKCNGHESAQFGVNINKSIFCNDIPFIFDLSCDNLGKYFSSKHFLHIPVHEFIHSSFLQNMQKVCQEKNVDFYKIRESIRNWNLSPFKRELREKISHYSSQNPLEMHAEYWAKEICGALDKKLQPKYNPMEEKQVKLSPLLTDFITKFSSCDFRAAKAILNKAAKEYKE